MNSGISIHLFSIFLSFPILKPLLNKKDTILMLPIVMKCTVHYMWNESSIMPWLPSFGHHLGMPVHEERQGNTPTPKHTSLPWSPTPIEGTATGRSVARNMGTLMLFRVPLQTNGVNDLNSCSFKTKKWRWKHCRCQSDLNFKQCLTRQGRRVTQDDWL